MNHPCTFERVIKARIKDLEAKHPYELHDNARLMELRYILAKTEEIDSMNDKV